MFDIQSVCGADARVIHAIPTIRRLPSGKKVSDKISSLLDKDPYFGETLLAVSRNTKRTKNGPEGKKGVRLVLVVQQ